MTPKAKDFWTNCCKGALDVAFARKCSLCETFGDENPCRQCRGEMTAKDPAISYRSDGDLAYLGSAFLYPGRAGQAVRSLKYRRRTGLVPFMANAVADAIQKEGLEFDLAVPIPIHWTRLAQRGFNQADLISRDLPNRVAALRRNRPTRPQAGLTTTERLKNLDGAFEVLIDVKGRSILLIDDVVTSGQTARECAKVLRLAGASEVGIFAFCGEIYE